MRKGSGRFAKFEEQTILFPLEDMFSEAKTEVTALCKNVVGVLDFEHSFTYTPQKTARSVFGSGAKEIKIPQQEIVGLCRTGPCSFEVWYCPLVSSKLTEVKRKLLKSPEFTILPGGTTDFGISPEQTTNNFIQHIRQACCWGTREEPPRVVVVSNSKCAKGRSSSLLHKMVLPILQDAAGLCVEVLEAERVEKVPTALNLAGTDLVVVLGSDAMSEEEMQAIFDQGEQQQAKVPVAFIPVGTAGSGLTGSPRSGWCPITTAYAICKGLTCNPDHPPLLQTPSPRQSVFLNAASGILNTLDESTANIQMKGEAGFVCEMLRDLVKDSNKSIRKKCGYLVQAASKPSPRQQHQDLLLGGDSDVHKKDAPAKTAPERQTRSPFTSGFGRGNACWSATEWYANVDCKDTVPAYRPLVGAHAPLSCSVHV